MTLAANLSAEPLAGIPTAKGREIFSVGAIEDGRLGPWSIAWSLQDGVVPTGPGLTGMPNETAKPVPRATYRLQFTKDFGFAQAADLAPYLAKLGISHIYASPYLRARAGSTHGYDIVSHTELNPELGPRQDFDRMVAAFRENGLGQILDFVPNHMGVGGADNPWWLDVLEWGPESEYAGWFDIDWEPDRRYLQNKLLVPFLGDQYGAALESGALALKFEPETGSFAVWAYGTHKLPICPRHYGSILGVAHPDLERLGDAFAASFGVAPAHRGARKRVEARTGDTGSDRPRCCRRRPARGCAFPGAARRFGELGRARRLDPGSSTGARHISESRATTSTIADFSTSMIWPAFAWSCRRSSTMLIR